MQSRTDVEPDLGTDLNSKIGYRSVTFVRGVCGKLSCLRRGQTLILNWNMQSQADVEPDLGTDLNSKIGYRSVPF